MLPTSSFVGVPGGIQNGASIGSPRVSQASISTSQFPSQRRDSAVGLSPADSALANPLDAQYNPSDPNTRNPEVNEHLRNLMAQMPGNSNLPPVGQSMNNANAPDAQSMQDVRNLINQMQGNAGSPTGGQSGFNPALGTVPTTPVTPTTPTTPTMHPMAVYRGAGVPANATGMSLSPGSFSTNSLSSSRPPSVNSSRLPIIDPDNPDPRQYYLNPEALIPPGEREAGVRAAQEAAKEQQEELAKKRKELEEEARKAGAGQPTYLPPNSSTGSASPSLSSRSSGPGLSTGSAEQSSEGSSSPSSSASSSSSVTSTTSSDGKPGKIRRIFHRFKSIFLGRGRPSKPLASQGDSSDGAKSEAGKAKKRPSLLRRFVKWLVSAASTAAGTTLICAWDDRNSDKMTRYKGRYRVLRHRWQVTRPLVFEGLTGEQDSHYSTRPDRQEPIQKYTSCKPVLLTVPMLSLSTADTPRWRAPVYNKTCPIARRPVITMR